MAKTAGILALTVLITATPCARGQTAPVSLRAADSAWSASLSRANMRETFASAFADDAWYLAAGAPLVRGNSHIADVVALDSNFTGATMTLRPARVEVARDSSFGYVYGYTHVTRASVSHAGKYIAVWRRDSARWMIAALVLVSAPEGAEPLAPASFASVTPAPSTSDARMDAIRTDAEFSARSIEHGLADAFTAFAAPDGATLSSDPAIVFGREGIARDNADVPSSILLAWTPMDGGAASTNDLAFTVGVATILVPATTNRPARVSHSKYLTVWKRQPDGSLRFVVDGGNALAVP